MPKCIGSHCCWSGLYSMQVILFQFVNIAMHQSMMVMAMCLLRLLPAGSIAVACCVSVMHSPLLHCIFLYCLKNMANGKCYIGQTINIPQWYRRQKTSHPSWMRSDVARFLPVEHYLVMDEVYVNDIAADKQHADRLERERLLTSSKRSCQNLALPLPLDVECASSFLAEQRLLQFLNEI